MKIYFKVCLVLAIAFALGGCYESKVPMASSEGSTLDPNLVGRWKAIVTEDDTTPAEMLILKFNDNEYYVRYQEEEEVTRCRAYMVMVDGVPFINLQLIAVEELDKKGHIRFLKEDERTFLFFRYSLSKDDVLTLKMVSDDFVKTEFKSSKALYEFIKKNLKNEKLYVEPFRFIKTSDNQD